MRRCRGVISLGLTKTSKRKGAAKSVALDDECIGRLAFKFIKDSRSMSRSSNRLRLGSAETSKPSASTNGASTSTNGASSRTAFVKAAHLRTCGVLGRCH
eukprot:10640641-Heterocapsa_arctica.AAC.1